MSTRIPREKAVFVEALEIADLEQRRQFLDQACGAGKALYEKVEKFLTLSQRAGDGHRAYLREEAVLARPHSQLHRLQKLVRRNRMVFLLGAVAVAAWVIGSACVSCWPRHKLPWGKRRLRNPALLRDKLWAAS